MSKKPAPEGRDKRGKGRPSKYKPEFDEQATRMCMLGLTDAELGHVFKVNEATINRWKSDHPSFMQALKDGREEADSKVARALFRRATGMSVPKDHISNYMGQVTITRIREYYPPDVTACNSWLNNRRRQNWQRTPDPSMIGEEPTPVQVHVTVTDARKRDA